uniref:Uncharacterized protein n=1 Tax=viral metagenome TaxID=1070528 RepID=A0A6C0B6U6_9ZZZZ
MNEFRLLFQIFLVFVLFSGIYVIFWVHKYSESFTEGLTATPMATTTAGPNSVTPLGAAPPSNNSNTSIPTSNSVTPLGAAPPDNTNNTNNINSDNINYDVLLARLIAARKGKGAGYNSDITGAPLSAVYNNQAEMIYPNGDTKGSYQPQEDESSNNNDNNNDNDNKHDNNDNNNNNNNDNNNEDDNNGSRQENDSKTGEQNLDDYVLNQHPVSLQPSIDTNSQVEGDNRENNVYSGPEKDFLSSTAAYPDSPYSPFDPLNEDINHYEYVAKEFASSQPTGLSDNPMDPNWGGVKFTQDVIKSGKYSENNITKPLLFQPKGLYIDAVPSAFGKPEDILE